MIYNITYEFNGKGIGWSETHAAQAPTENPRDLQGHVLQVGQKRANFLGSPFVIQAIRIARFLDENTQTRVRGTFLVKQEISAQDKTLVRAAEPGNVALIAKGSTLQTAPDLVIFNGNQNNTFLGGPPDAAVDNAGTVIPANAGLGAAFDSWGTAMIATGFGGITLRHGWNAVKRVVDTKINNITQNLDGTVRIVTELPVIPPLVVNNPGKVRIRRVNQGRSPLNRELIVFPSDSTTMDTYEVIGIPTAQVGGRLRAYAINPVFLSYAALTLELETGKHKRGRPPGSTRGRAPVVIRG